MNNQKNMTFLTYTELLTSQLERCREVCLDLQRFVANMPANGQKVLEVVINHEEQLAQVITEFLRLGPKKVLDTRLQYTPDCKKIEQTQTLSDAFEQLVGHNENILEQYESAINNTNTDIAESLATLANNVKSHCRQVSMALVTMQDA